MATGFSFDFKPSSSGNQTLSLGTTTTTSGPLQFGVTPNSQTTTTSSGAIFQLPTTTGFNTPSTTTVTSAGSNQFLGFGTSFSTTATTKPSFGTTPIGTTATSNVPSFGSAGLNFGTTTITSTTNLLSYGGSTAITSATTSTPSTGLGGISTTDFKTGTATTVTTTAVQKEIPPKEQPLPNEILQTVESFKAHVKKEKQHSSDISRISMKEYQKVEEDMDSINNLLREMEYELQRNKSIAEKLKYDTAKDLQYIEMAQRTQDTPLGLQYENNAPMQFFMDLVDNFEKEMHVLKTQLETIDQVMKNSQSHENISSQDITNGMKRLHETFVALAGRLQTVHNQVETQKEMFLNLRKNILNDNTNIFEDKTKEEDNIRQVKYNSYVPPSLSAGPTPFNAAGKSHTYLFAQNPLSDTSTNSTIQESSANLSFGTSNFNFPLNQQYGLQLTKPPVGNKRGKT